MDDVFAGIKPSDRISILVDGSDRATLQLNLDHASALAERLRANRQLTGVWISTPTSVFEYIDHGRAFSLDRDHAGVFGALTILSVQETSKVLLITAHAVPKGVYNFAKPTIGFCTASPCEPTMKGLVKTTGGFYVPYKG
jgi:hypothetical protein